MDDKDPHGPVDPGPGQSRGHSDGDGPPPRLRSRGRSEVIPPTRSQSPGLSTSLPIPVRSNSSREKTSQSFFRDEGPHLRSQGPSEALQHTTAPSSVSVSIPEGANYSGEKAKLSVSLSRGRSGSEGLPPPPPSPGQTAGLSVSLPIEESADSGGEKAKQDVSRDEKVSNGLFTCNEQKSKCFKDPDVMMDLSGDNTDQVEDPLGARKRKCSTEMEDFDAVMVRTTKFKMISGKTALLCLDLLRCSGIARSKKKIHLEKTLRRLWSVAKICE